MDALFCCCREGQQQTENRLRRDLFHLTEIKGRTLADAARGLGLEFEDAEMMLARTRRDVAVLLALGLCKPSSTETAGEVSSHDCSCRGI
ncbi:MAG: hypothetical protein GC186_20055 [Rhodobacteraceae bacterium]|nr:hypothetical protein [Paracoccaceae bacterium]